MIRRLSLVLLLLALTAAPAFAQASLEGDLREARKHFPPRGLSPAQQAELLNLVAWNHAQDGWGLLAKPSGNNCPLPSGTRVSCDYLVFAPTGQGFDVLEDAEGAANVKWNPGDSFDRSRWVAPEKPAGAPDPPVVEPPTGTPGTTVLERVIVIGVRVEDTLQRIDALTLKVQVLEQELDRARIALEAAAARPWPTYTTTLFGQRLTLTPK